MVTFITCHQIQYLQETVIPREREMFYLTTHSTHFIYGYMTSDIWLRTILIVRKETRCRHIGYSYRLTARVLLYAPSHRQDNTYHSLCYTRHGALAGTRNSSMGPPPEGSIRRPITRMLYLWATSRSPSFQRQLLVGVVGISIFTHESLIVIIPGVSKRWAYPAFLVSVAISCKVLAYCLYPNRWNTYQNFNFNLMSKYGIKSAIMLVVIRHI